ncbi:hypothetical protein [Micromonospora sp. 067-2]|uniref:hypothetical protein n=1 Tax=Micromonospora sp. 067-2 TaxID=2789270 RepID=UPI00397DB4E4
MIAQAEPVTITVPDAGRVVAALGMVCKLATDEVDKDPADAAGILTDAADAIVGLGALLKSNGDALPMTIGGRTLVYSRTVLTRAVERLTTGAWMCTCREAHQPGKPCTLVSGLTADLNVVGGWLTMAEEQRGDDR